LYPILSFLSCFRITEFFVPFKFFAFLPVSYLFHKRRAVTVVLQYLLYLPIAAQTVDFFPRSGSPVVTHKTRQ
jgi:hypothetical protein